MNILIIEDKASVTYGGAEKSMFNYILQLKEQGHFIHLVYDRPGDWLEPERASVFNTISKISVLPITVQGIKNYFISIQELIKILKENQIDFIFTHVIHGFPFFKIVKTITPIKVAVFFKWVPNSKSIGFIGKIGASAVDIACASTKYVADYWHLNGIKVPIALIPNGIKVNCLSKPVNFTIKPHKLLFLGRIYEGKGLHLILEVLPKLKDIILYVGGSYDYTQEHEHLEYHKCIKDYINDNDLSKRVVFLQNVDNPISYMDNETLVIVPSIWPEAQSRVLLEAMATQTPVIASNIGGIPEVVGDFQQEILFEPNAGSLYIKIEEVLNRTAAEQSRLSMLLHSRFIDNYDLSSTHLKLNQFLSLN